MPKSAYRVLYRVGRRVANGRLYGTSTYKGIRAFLRRKLVEDEVVETNGFKMVVDRDLSAFDPHHGGHRQGGLGTRDGRVPQQDH